MLSLRAHLRRLSALWLTIQITAIAAGTVAAASGSVGIDQNCTCPGSDHQTCPMHHPSPHRSRCVVENATAPLDAAMLSLTIWSGVLPPTTAAMHTSLSFSSIAIVARASVWRADLPDAPPPRA